MSAVGAAVERATLAEILSDLARRVLTLSHSAVLPDMRAHLRRAAQQLSIQGELVAAGGDVEVAEAYIDAGRVFVAELEATSGGAKLRDRI